MTISNRTEKIQERLEKEFKKEITHTTINIKGRMRISFGEGKFLDIRYPRDDSYSFHFQSLHNELRIDCAPHHNELKTFPNHFHHNIVVKEDKWTDPTGSFSDNLDGLIIWIQEEIIPLL